MNYNIINYNIIIWWNTIWSSKLHCLSIKQLRKTMASTQCSVRKQQDFKMCLHFYNMFEKRLEDLKIECWRSDVIKAVFILVFIFSCDIQIFYNELRLLLDNVNYLYREAFFISNSVFQLFLLVILELKLIRYIKCNIFKCSGYICFQLPLKWNCN